MIRNFYAQAHIDGSKTILRGGPRCKDGGMELTLYVRQEGEIKTALEILCTSGCPPCEASDDLLISVTLPDDLEVTQEGRRITIHSTR